MNKVATHKEICEVLNKIYERKNHDYGDSFAKTREIIPNAILVRLFDKYLRLETLLNQEGQPMVSESIEDTLMDLANYCIMELIERKVDQEHDSIRQRDSTTDRAGQYCNQPIRPEEGKPE